MGVVIDVNQKTNMMLVNFPKKSQSKWIPWNNLGHYIVISWTYYLHILIKGTTMRLILFLLLTSCNYSAINHRPADASSELPDVDYVHLHHKICTIEDFETIDSDATYEQHLDDCLNETSKSLKLYAF